MQVPSRPARRRRGATMQDVADLSNVSKQTVSAVINDKPGITEETRVRVLAAIEQINYRMDLTARSLRTGRTHTVALLVTDISSPVLGTMASAAEERLYAENYNLVLYNTHDDLERERFYVDSILQRSVDGVMFVSAWDESTALDKLEAAGIPIVVVDRVPQNYGGPAVVLDNILAGRLAAAHLLALGHRRLAHIGGPAEVHIARERLNGFQAVLAEHGIDCLAIERADDWHVESGCAAMQRLLARERRLYGGPLRRRPAGHRRHARPPDRRLRDSRRRVGHGDRRHRTGGLPVAAADDRSASRSARWQRWAWTCCWRSWQARCPSPHAYRSHRSWWCGSPPHRAGEA